uniref:Uncharacterized protein n=1 Tax=viral metagenome TaxID=1070528 RepID=A0A6C0JI25_9ZZZZ
MSYILDHNYIDCFEKKPKFNNNNIDITLVDIDKPAFIFRTRIPNRYNIWFPLTDEIYNHTQIRKIRKPYNKFMLSIELISNIMIDCFDIFDIKD